MLSGILPIKKGENVLRCDLEYQASTIFFQMQSEIKGYEIRCVETRNGRVTREDFKRYIADNTRAIILAFVQVINDFCADVKSIGELAGQYGIYFVVYGIQEVGELKVDVRELGMDYGSTTAGAFSMLQELAHMVIGLYPTNTEPIWE